MEKKDSTNKNKKEQEHKIKSKKRKKRHGSTGWLVKAFILALSLCLLFSSLSELVLSSSGLIIAILIIILFLVIAIIADILGVAVTACDDNAFNAMAARKIRGAKEALFLIRNSDKVASFMCDIVGDICGILSGSAGAAIVIKFVQQGDKLGILISTLVSSLIASLTVLGKAAGKAYAKKNYEKIVFSFGKMLSVFSKNKK